MTVMKVITASLVTFFIIIAAFGARAQDADSWRLVAQSDAIVTGRLGSIDTPLPGQSYVATEILDPIWLKGDGEGRLILNWYSEARPYAPSPEIMLGLSDERVIVFAVKVDGKYYFAGHSPEAIRSAEDALLAMTAAEILRQEQLLAHWHDDPTVPHYDEVAGLIAKIAALDPASRTTRQDQQVLFDALIALGPAAVPAMIMQMDDDRPLANSAISLRNTATDAFEAYRHYGPKSIGEALAAILNQITGESFESTYNGGNAEERARSVAGWRIYFANLRGATSDALP